MKQLVLDTNSLGNMVKNARKTQALSQEELAGLTGTGRRFISDLENGKETCHIGKTFLVLNTLGIALMGIQEWNDKEG